MKFNLKFKGAGAKYLLASGIMLASLGSIAQNRAAVLADPKLAAMVLTDFSGHSIDATNLQTDQLVKLKLPVACDNHGLALPAGSCKIKIGLGSKLVLDPGFDLNNAGMSNYFTWTVLEDGGQFQITGELVNPLPASVTAVDLSFRLKVKEEGSSAITANFLITNHNSLAVLSDENGANNAAAVSYKVSGKVPVDPSVVNGNLKLNVFPNPAKDVFAVNISVKQGKLMGRYKVSMYDLAGKLVQAKTLQLDYVTNFAYHFGALASGKYLIKVESESGAESTLLKFEKL
ncbi:MAG: T9SS type A sorting domain-containing protein [Rhizobacter sp.]|nr:T9SS type A sorting domain-containing protein [Ferruginibacter sp.]